jgi:putative uncharacterized protein FNV2255
MKYLDKVDEKVLVKKLTEKMWKKYKGELDSKRLKNLLKDILKEEKVGFTYTWRINDCRDFGVMFGNTFEKYREVIRKFNYTQTREYYDAKFTKEVDTTFEYKKDNSNSNLKLIENLFDVRIEKDYYDNIYIVGTVNENVKEFLKSYGYDFYKKYINYGKYNGKSYKEKRFYLVS